MELALVAPLFVLFLVLSLQAFQIFRARMEMSMLLRQFAVMQGRMADMPTVMTGQTLVETLAVSETSLQPHRLVLHVGSATGADTPNAMGGLTGSSGSGLAAHGFLSIFMGRLAGQVLGEKITLIYMYPLPGFLGSLFPAGLPLTTSCVCKTDSGNHLLIRLFNSLF